MIFDKSTMILKQNGFQYVPDNGSSFALFIRPDDSNCLDVCVLINNEHGSGIGPQIIDNLNSAIDRKFLLSGYHRLNTIYMVISNNVERDKIFLQQNYATWIIDAYERRIMIFDNQPNDFCQLKQSFESMLTEEANPVKIQWNHFPFMTALIILCNILVFFYIEIHGGTEDSYNMLHYGASYWKLIFEDQEYYRLFTCMFLHFGSEHLLNNMLTLGFIGAEIEKTLGHIRFTIIYLLSGLGSSFLSAYHHMISSDGTIIVSAGASGAIFGVLGSLLVVKFLYRKDQIIRPSSLIIIALLTVSNGFLSSSTDNSAHIGGILCGGFITAISCLCRKNKLE